MESTGKRKEAICIALSFDRRTPKGDPHPSDGKTGCIILSPDLARGPVFSEDLHMAFE